MEQAWSGDGFVDSTDPEDFCCMCAWWHISIYQWDHRPQVCLSCLASRDALTIEQHRILARARHGREKRDADTR